MKYQQTVLEEESMAMVSEVVSLEQAVRDTYPDRKTIFHPTTWWYQLRLRTLIFLARLAELIFGRVYKENIFQDLRFLSPTARHTLTQLVDQELLKSWKMNQVLPGLPHFHQVNLEPHLIRTPAGTEYKMGGATGAGVGTSTEAALYPAIGEFLERLASSTWWERADIVKATAAKAPKAVSIKPWLWHESAQLAATDFVARKYTDDAILSWVPATDFVTGKQRLVPAQFVYAFYTHEHKDEPFLWQANSNGTAAHTTLEQATYGAVTELIERDAFMRAWHHGRLPRKISLTSVLEAVPEVAQFLREAMKRGVEYHILDCTDDIAVPTIVVLGFDPQYNGVMVTASCDHDVYQAIGKAVKENYKFLHGAVSRDEILLERYQNGEYAPNDLSDRYRLWAHPEMIAEARWFTESTNEVDVAGLVAEYGSLAEASTAEKLADCRKKLETVNASVYIADVTTSFTCSFNMRVVRAVSPDLIQVYFGEWELPLNASRLRYTTDGARAELLGRIHPFV